MKRGHVSTLRKPLWLTGSQGEFSGPGPHAHRGGGPGGVGGGEPPTPGGGGGGGGGGGSPAQKVANSPTRDGSCENKQPFSVIYMEIIRVFLLLL